MQEKIRIIFMGTPEFAVASLKRLVDEGYNVVAVVTAPDKPSGRGQKLKHSAVKQFAIEHEIPVLQPVYLNDAGFISQLKSFRCELQIVVAFRILPEAVWSLPVYGTFNLHASLLPDYRGAAPINWVLINGEEYTGVTTFFINEQIDTGAIIFRKKVRIGKSENASELHDRLKEKGASLVIKTAEAICRNQVIALPQNELINPNTPLHTAPKIHKNDCHINWDRPANEIFNFIRGLSEYPGAFTELISPSGERYYVKILKTEIETGSSTYKTGQIETNQKDFLKISVRDGYIYITELQLSSKIKMNITNFLRGFKLNNTWSV